MAELTATLQKAKEEGVCGNCKKAYAPGSNIVFISWTRNHWHQACYEWFSLFSAMGRGR